MLVFVLPTGLHGVGSVYVMRLRRCTTVLLRTRCVPIHQFRIQLAVFFFMHSGAVGCKHSIALLIVPLCMHAGACISSQSSCRLYHAQPGAGEGHADASQLSQAHSTHAAQTQVHASAAKAAVDSITRSLALEWGEYGVRVVGVAPGPIAGTAGERLR